MEALGLPSSRADEMNRKQIHLKEVRGIIYAERYYDYDNLYYFKIAGRYFGDPTLVVRDASTRNDLPTHIIEASILGSSHRNRLPTSFRPLTANRKERDTS